MKDRQLPAVVGDMDQHDVRRSVPAATAAEGQTSSFVTVASIMRPYCTQYEYIRLRWPPEDARTTSVVASRFSPASSRLPRAKAIPLARAFGLITLTRLSVSVIAEANRLSAKVLEAVR